MIGLAFLAAAAAAQPGSVEFDIQCMVVLQSAADQMSGPEKAGLQVGAQFFFGRVDSVLSGKALEDRMLSVGAAVANSPLQPIIQGCGQFMTERGELLMEVGKAVEAREQASNTR